MSSLRTLTRCTMGRHDDHDQQGSSGHASEVAPAAASAVDVLRAHGERSIDDGNVRRAVVTSHKIIVN